ncbi:Dual serine/threonine and tyrosine protein kinase [Fasciola hepatica]|uniref:Dual serine/threonine and tyrosine protein kinase n=1 Tax=Fasciola hepatica TaxID=6192 RepID=A0A4E0R6I5_FASHE|nr:Dual serine/threonine and tyrosine protein kinase [Fasciola hepatica]
MTIGKEIKRFKKHRNVIKKSLRDLRKSFRSIEEDEFNAHFLRNSGIDCHLPSNAEQQCTQIAEDDIAIIILGQNNYAKAAVFNELLHREILPTEISDDSTSWRLINLHHGLTNSVSLRERQNSSNSGAKSGSTAEKSTYEQSQIENILGGKALFVSITLTGEPLLVDGLRVLVSSSCHNKTVDELCHLFEDTCKGVLPIFLYALQCKELTPWDLIELTELRRLAHDHPILFVIVPPRKVYEASIQARKVQLMTPVRGPASAVRETKPLPTSLTRTWYRRSNTAVRKDNNYFRPPRHSLELDIKARACFCPKLGDKARGEPGVTTSTIDPLHPSMVRKLLQIPHPQNSENRDSDNVFERVGERESYDMSSTTSSINELDQAEFQSKLVSILVHLGFLTPCTTQMKTAEHAQSPSTDSVQSDDSEILRTVGGPNGSLNKSEGTLKNLDNGLIQMSSEVLSHFQQDFDAQLHSFVRRRLHGYLMWATNTLNKSATECLKGFVLQAYDLAHDLIVTPKRLEFARTQEAKLYESMLQTAKKRQPTIMSMVSDTLKEMREYLPATAARDLDFRQLCVLPTNRTPERPTSAGGNLHPSISSAAVTEVKQSGDGKSAEMIPSVEQSCPHAHGIREARSQPSLIFVNSHSRGPIVGSSSIEEIKPIGRNPGLNEYKLAARMVREYVLQRLTSVIASRVLECMEVMQQSCVGTLERTIINLERLTDNELTTQRVASCPYLDCITDAGDANLGLGSPDDALATVSPSNDRTMYVSLHGEMALPPGESKSEILSMPASSLGKGRCICHSATVPGCCTPPQATIGSSSVADIRTADAALKALLRFTYSITVPMKRTMTSQMSILLDRLRKAFVGPISWRGPMELDEEWTERAAQTVLNELSDTSIAKRLCVQITEKLRQSHENFLTTLRRLEVRTEIRNCRFEEAQENILKQHAPRLSRVALDTSALRSYLRFGLPVLGKELGRGQYGVVYASSPWGGHTHLAVKSVVPPDDKHWKDLSLEIYYSKQIPEHERIVTMYDSVIDYDHGHGTQPAVLVIMERLVRDLHTAIKQGLPWLRRLIVARDVAEGIRFLHSQGLVHRDIKPRNVLLDSHDRAKLTDLGFCKPYAMMGGSILGTPMHMAPEIFEQNYDYSVDIYAFGILFWYICAGKVQMPRNFEQCGDKDGLWHAVRKGIRPERLKTFTKECWELMEQCWTRSIRKRPHSGHIVDALEQIYRKELQKAQRNSNGPNVQDTIK